MRVRVRRRVSCRFALSSGGRRGSAVRLLLLLLSETLLLLRGGGMSGIGGSDLLSLLLPRLTLGLSTSKERLIGLFLRCERLSPLTLLPLLLLIALLRGGGRSGTAFSSFPAVHSVETCIFVLRLAIVRLLLGGKMGLLRRGVLRGMRVLLVRVLVRVRRSRERSSAHRHGKLASSELTPDASDRLLHLFPRRHSYRKASEADGSAR
jgi:hypothetical protein